MSGYEAIEEAIHRLRSSEDIYDHVSQRKATAEIKRLRSNLAAAQSRVTALEGENKDLKLSVLQSAGILEAVRAPARAIHEMRLRRSSPSSSEYYDILARLAPVMDDFECA